MSVVVVEPAQIRAESRIDPVTGSFRLFSWSELTRIISDGALHVLTRTPDQLRLYKTWKTGITERFGSVEAYVLQERLGWTDHNDDDTTTPLLTPTSLSTSTASSGWKCLKNDFPYACEPGIDHLVIWLKSKLPTTPDGNHPTQEAVTSIESFIASYFAGVESHNILYFLNPPALKSIGSLEHFHVLLHHQDVSLYL